jgi:hypothetical protein
VSDTDLGLVMCPMHKTHPKSVFNTFLARGPILGHLSCKGKVSSSCFVMQVGVVRFFGVQLMVIFPY